MTKTALLTGVLLTGLAFHTTPASAKEPLTFRDLMQFRQISDASIAKDGKWIAYTLSPGRGEGEAVARSTVSRTEHRVARCQRPVLSGDSRWLACAIQPTQQERDEAAGKKPAADGKDDGGPRKGLAIVNLSSGSQETFEEVESFAFSDDGRWLLWKRYKPRKDKDVSASEATNAEPQQAETEGVQEEELQEEAKKEEKEEQDKETEDDEDRPVGTTVVLRDLANGVDLEIEHVTAYAFDEPSRHLAYVVAGPGGKSNGAFILDLGREVPSKFTLAAVESGRYTHLVWAEKSSRVAWIATVDDDLHEPGPADVWTWNGGEPERLASSKGAPDGWRIPSKNRLSFSRDGQRLFFGYEWIDPIREKRRLEKQAEKREERARKEAAESEATAEKDEEPYDPFDFAALLDKRKLDVWHWKDPFIIPHQKKQWKETEQHRVYLAVAHLSSGKVVRLADRELPDVIPSNHSRAVLAASNLDYRREVTWDGRHIDLYHVNLLTGARQRVAERLRQPGMRLSPDGRYVVYWNARHWHLFDANTGKTRNLTAGLDVSFANEDDDYPAPDPGYGVADWVEDSSALLIYDKFDVWRFHVDGRSPVSLTAGAGRAERRQFRVVDLDPEREFVQPDERLLLHGYHDRIKNDGFWQTRVDRPALDRLLEGPKRFRVVAKAEDADRVLYTRESYREFPDLWVAGSNLTNGRKLSDANPQIDRFAWGNAERVEWRSADGIPLQGVLIKPGNYKAGQRYPVLVYFYRFFSQRLHQFNAPLINHRPSFPIYASNGYAVFLPDVRFEIGRPGLSAVKALVPGVQKLVEMGIADPDAIGLHGHSWSGYQAAHVITQTDVFAAAVAGAPVSNMTSAYSGIRLGSGLARQFQYEQSQSRIGGSLDAALPKYIENSPVFHVRHIKTPLLIQFGDQDEAVPWQQGIELYLAMRRLDKDVVFLQYRGEPHHLKQYPNKLDYSIKMKEFFDHHLKGAPAPEWMTRGVPYRGE